MSLFKEAEKVYRALGVDVEAAFRRTAAIPVSVYCFHWLNQVKDYEKTVLNKR